LEQDVLPGLADSGLLLGFIQDGYFIDIGIPEDLTRARREMAHVQRRPAALLGIGSIALLSARIRRMKRQFQVLLGRFLITIQHLTDSQPGQRWRTRRVKQRETRCGSILTAV